MKNKEIAKDFTKYVSLNIFSQLAYSFYTMADTFFVSRDLGTNSLTALNLAFPIFCVINGLGLMIGIGGGSRYTVFKSQNEDKKANIVFTNAIYISIFFSIIFFSLGLFYSGPIVRFLGADDKIFNMANTYLKTMLLFSPAFILNAILVSFIRNDGGPTYSTAAMIISSVSNIILDYIFIYPLNMGIFGAILATGLSPIISIVVLSLFFIKRKNKFSFIKTKLTKEIYKISSTGITPLITELTSGVVMFLFNMIILKLNGNVGVAAFGIVSVIMLAVTAIYNGLSQGIQPLLSLNYGIKNKDNIKFIFKYAILTSFIISIILYSIIYFKADFIQSIFNSEQNIELQTLAIRGLKLYFMACPFVGINIVLATYFLTTNNVLKSQLISLLRGFIILIPTSIILSILLKLDGVYLSYLVSEFIVSIIGITFLIIEKKRRTIVN